MQRIDIRMENDVITDYFKRISPNIIPNQQNNNANMSNYIYNWDPNNTDTMNKMNKLGKNFDNWVDLMSLSVKSNSERSELLLQNSKIPTKEVNSNINFKNLMEDVADQ